MFIFEARERLKGTPAGDALENFIEAYGFDAAIELLAPVDTQAELIDIIAPYQYAGQLHGYDLSEIDVVSAEYEYDISHGWRRKYIVGEFIARGREYKGVLICHWHADRWREGVPTEWWIKY